MTRAYSTLEVAAATGLSYRALDYWIRNNVIRPSVAGASGSGSRREFSEMDIAVLRAVGRVVEDLGDLGLQASVRLIGLLWEGLHQKQLMIIDAGTITINIDRGGQ